MAAVLSSRLVKHYSAPCRPLPPFPSLPSLCANSRSPFSRPLHPPRAHRLLSVAGILCKDTNPCPNPPSPASSRSSVLCELLTDVQSQTRKRNERKKIGGRKDERSQCLYDDGSLADLSEVFIRSKKTRNPLFRSFFVCPSKETSHNGLVHHV